MKNIGKISSLMIAFSVIANTSLASSYETPSNGMKLGSIVPLVIGALLVGLVLFLGYKMDKEPEDGNIMKKEKTTKKAIEVMPKEEISEEEETEIYQMQNRNDIPYEKDENEFYEKDKNFDKFSLNEEEEYEEDDISLFISTEQEDENLDEDISFEDSIRKEYNEDDFNSTMIFDSSELNNELNQVEEDKEELEYTAPVEGLDEKIDNLDKDDFEGFMFQEETQSAESFINELKKYEETIDENISNFTTQNVPKNEVQKKYTKKKEVEEIIQEDTALDINFLEQMEENLKKDKETREEKSAKKKTTTKSSTKKKTTSKSTEKKTRKKKEE